MDGGRCVGAVTVVLRLPGVFDMTCLGSSVLWGLLGYCLCFSPSLDVFGDVVGSNRVMWLDLIGVLINLLFGSASLSSDIDVSLRFSMLIYSLIFPLCPHCLD